MLETVPEPFFFGKTATPLFGCYHAPSLEPAKRTGVILSYPFGHEYIRMHRSYRQLAVRLAQAGYPVLRFDFAGCGDSAGDERQGGLQPWCDDLSTAIDTMRERYHASALCLIGARLGAALAMFVGANHRPVQSMVLWNPIVDGRAYLMELNEFHRLMLDSSHASLQGSTAGDEMLGFQLSPSFKDELERHLRLEAITVRLAKSILIIDGPPGVDGDLLTPHLTRLGCSVDHRRINGVAPWMWVEDVARAVVPVEVLNTIVSWVGQTCP